MTAFLLLLACLAYLLIIGMKAEDQPSLDDLLRKKMKDENGGE